MGNEHAYAPLWDAESPQEPLTSRRGRFVTWLMGVYSVLCTLLLARYAFGEWNGAAAGPEGSRYPQASLLQSFNEKVRYRVETAPRSWSQRYSGLPSDELEDAWNEVLHGGHDAPQSHGIAITAAEAKDLGIEKSLRGSDGSFVVITALSHNLHCLRRIRQSLYSEHYYPNATEDELSENQHHALHCVEAIVESQKCRPDLSVHPYSWNEQHAMHPVEVPPARRRQCADWETVQQALVERRTYDNDELIRTHVMGVVD